MRVVQVIDDGVAHLFLQMRRAHTETRHAVDDVHDEMEAVDLIEDGELQRRVDVAALSIAMNVQIRVLTESELGTLLEQKA